MITSPKTLILNEKSAVETVELSRSSFGRNSYLIGDRRSGSFLLVDYHWVKLLPFLDGKVSLREISRLTGTEINLVKVFVLSLVKASLIKKIDNLPLVEDTAIPLAKPSGQRWLPDLFVLTILGSALFSLFFMVLASLTNPKVVPDTSDFFWSSRQSLNLLSSLVFSSVSLIIHEFFHYLFAKIYGLKASFSLSNRLFFLVAETKLRSIFSLRRWRRIAIFTSGSAIELIIMALVFIIKIRGDFPDLQLKLLNQFLLIEIVSILWQFLFFMKTDFYYVIGEIVGNYNLQEEAADLILRRRRDNRATTQKNGRGLLLYTTFLVIGSSVAIYRYLTYNLPIIIGLLTRSFNTLFTNLKMSSNWVVNTPTILDAAIIFSLETLYLSTLIIVLIRKNKKAH